MMLIGLKNKVQRFWKVGHERTLNIKKNIVYSFLIRGMSVLTGFLLVPVTIHYVNTVQYGIWLTIASLVAWINTFDIGLSNGLRNKLANAFALNQNDDAVKYISTTYALLFIIAGASFVLFYFAGTFFNWNQLLHIPKTIGYNIWPIVIIALASFCVQFMLQPVNSILTANHHPFKASLILLGGQLLTLALTYLLAKYTSGNLIILVVIAAGSPIFVLLFSTIYFFKTSLKQFAPEFSFVDFKSAKSLLNTGGVFFFIQIGALILYETDNIIITRTLGPNEVTVFNIAYKYFSIITVVFLIFINPYWSAFTDAYAKDDFAWIKQSIKKMRKLWLAFLLLTLILYLFSQVFYRFWIKEKVEVPDMLSLSVAVSAVLQAWMVIHSYFLNGVEKLRVQLILVIGAGIVNIPLSVWLINRIGVSGTVVANIIVMVIINIFITWQTSLVINKKATGIWSR